MCPEEDRRGLSSWKRARASLESPPVREAIQQGHSKAKRLQVAQRWPSDSRGQG